MPYKGNRRKSLPLDELLPACEGRGDFLPDPAIRMTEGVVANRLGEVEIEFAVRVQTAFFREHFDNLAVNHPRFGILVVKETNHGKREFLDDRGIRLRGGGSVEADPSEFVLDFLPMVLFSVGNLEPKFIFS